MSDTESELMSDRVILGLVVGVLKLSMAGIVFLAYFLTGDFEMVVVASLAFIIYVLVDIEGGDA